MANTKVTSRVLADDAVGLAQLNISNDPSDGQALTYDGNSTNLQWASVGVTGISSSADATAITIDSNENVLLGVTSLNRLGSGSSAVSFSIGNTGTGTTDSAEAYLYNAATASGRVVGAVCFGTSGASASEKRSALISSKLSATSSTNVSGELNFYTTNAGSIDERMTITNEGRVGIGTSSPSQHLTVHGSDNNNLIMSSNSGGNSNTMRIQANNAASYIVSSASVPLIFDVVNTERMRIDNAGSIFFNTTSGYGTPKYSILWVQMASGSQRGISFKASSSTATDNPCLFFNTGGGVCGSISTTYSATAYNTSSDYRLKENVVYDWNATTRLKQLKPCRFNWISDETNTPIDGFLAHEAAEVVPNAVTGEKDATKDAFLDDDGNEIVGTTIEAQVMDYSKLVPLLVKTIQELEARIETLEDN